MTASINSFGYFSGCSSLRIIDFCIAINDFNLDECIDECTDDVKEYISCYDWSSDGSDEWFSDDSDDYTVFNLGFGAFHGCRSLDSNSREHIIMYSISNEDIEHLFDDTIEQMVEELGF